MPRYRSINWDDESAQEALNAECTAVVKAGKVGWNDLTYDAQTRIERECMKAMEARRREAFNDYAADEAEELIQFEARR